MMVQSLLNCTRCRLSFVRNLSLFRSIVIRFYSDSVGCLNKNGNLGSVIAANANDSCKAIECPVLAIPEPPTTCCMSGCANCVWIQYAEQLESYFKDGGELARKRILETVTDDSMRAFLMMELRTMNLK